MRVLLVGLMASGKSTLGQAISAASGWPVLDNDVLLERSTGCSAVVLLEQQGLAALRAAESHVLTLTLTTPGPLVAGVAAGVVLDVRDRERLRLGGHVVYLRTPVGTLARRVEALARRVSTVDHRPFLDDDQVVVLQAMSDERDPLYLEVASQVLDMAVLSPQQAVDAVLAALTD